jgi:SAM-dependent methyltransferase
MLRSIKRVVRRSLEKTTLGYLAMLKHDHDLSGSPGKPDAPWHNAVLQTRADLDAAVQQVTRLGLPSVHRTAKNWDTLGALDCILRHTGTRARILDASLEAGAEVYARILPWLCMYGYRRLEGINLGLEKPRRMGPMIYKFGDIQRTDYPAECFDAIACLSAIEHGIDLNAYFREMSRILKPGGILVTSTDYWEAGLDTQGKEMFGVPVHVFNKQEIVNALATAGENSLLPTGPLDLSCTEKAVHWSNVDLDFTFVVFTLRKRA